jgi:hypothetical protein
MDKIMKDSNSRFERDAFNATQNFLYKRALYGLKVYDKEELHGMNPDKRKRIEKVSRRCQSILNIWKQEICNSFTNNLLMTLFPGRELAKLFYVTYKDATDPRFVNTLNFKDLGVSKKQIVDKLIYEGILPRDFYNLKNVDSKEEKV